jgi:hypothetical protein
MADWKKCEVFVLHVVLALILLIVLFEAAEVVWNLSVIPPSIFSVIAALPQDDRA